MKNTFWVFMIIFITIITVRIIHERKSCLSSQVYNWDNGKCE